MDAASQLEGSGVQLPKVTGLCPEQLPTEYHEQPVLANIALGSRKVNFKQIGNLKRESNGTVERGCLRLGQASGLIFSRYEKAQDIREMLADLYLDTLAFPQT